MGWLSFTSLPFLLAGAICATGPVIIHLLNRRRYRVVQWAAMDFLREALKKNRKILQLRDLVLLVLRTLAVLLFGAALARPYLARGKQQFDARQPMHAVIILDNSLSMAYESLEGSLLDKAKERARELIDRLPAGSQMTVFPACGARESLSFDSLLTGEDAKEALARIEVVDRSAKIALVANLARRACEEAPQLAKRIFFFTDQQELNWNDARADDLFRGLPAMQVVSVAPSAPDNAWISDLQLQDGLADLETPATVVVKIAHRGNAPRRDVPLTLSVGRTVIGQQAVTIEPGFGTREVSFACTLSGLVELPEPGQAVFVSLQAAIGPDRLPADDQRCLAVPVVAALPVIFIDQYGPDEDAARGRLGETRHLRRLLAPRTSHSDAPRQLISVRHIAPDGLSRELLADARLVVVAGVRQPGPMVDLLADYVRHGGRLMVAAGADFDPMTWNSAGWQDGNGILPLPLMSEPIGGTPEESADKVEPFSLAFESLTDEAIFRLAGVGEGDLKSLYAEPFFFKAVRVDESPTILEQLKKKVELAAAGDNGDEPSDGDHEPHVFARFEGRDRAIFLVARQIGRGNVLFCSTGLLSSWNTLPKTNSILVFDRLLRGMIQGTLPEQNIAPADRLTLPLPRLNQNVAMTLSRPGRVTEDPLEVTYIGAQQRGVALTGLLSRGIYQVRGRRLSSSSDVAAEKPVWETPIAVNGASEESDLTTIAGSEFDRITAGADIRLIGAEEAISVAGAATGWQNSWWWLMLGVLALLVAEMLVLIKP